MRIALIAALSLIALAGTADARPREEGEARLAKLLQGRVAGSPVDCIRTFPNNDMTIIDKTAIVFGHGNVIYVNRTQDPDSIDDKDGIFVRKFGDPSRLCTTDVVTSFDTMIRHYTGNVMLTEFIPYRRVGR